MNDNEVEDRIVSSARKLFLENGYGEVNMSQIAEAAGITRPTVYYYFRTKDRIFQAVFNSILDELLPKLLLSLRNNLPARDKIEKFVEAYFDNFLNHPEIPLFIVKEIKRDTPHLLKVIRDMGVKDYFDELKTFYDREVANGTMKNVPYITIFFTFFGLVSAPFLSEDLACRVYYGKDGDSPAEFPRDKNEGLRGLVGLWKPYVVSQMRYFLLTGEGD